MARLLHAHHSIYAIVPLVVVLILLVNKSCAFSVSPVHKHLYHLHSAPTTTTSLSLFKRLRSKFAKKTQPTPIPKTDDSSDADDEFAFQTYLKSRRTINEFEKTLPSNWEESLHRAITTAIYAPNHKRTEPWRFHLLGPQSIEKVCKLNAELVSAKKGKEAGEKKLKRWLDMPGWLVVTCQKSKINGSASSDEIAATTMEDPTSLAREDYAAVCCAVQNLCLSLHSEGMGAKWTTGPVNFDERFADAVGFKGEDEYVVGTIWFGTPKDGKIPDAPKKKFSMEDVLVTHD